MNSVISTLYVRTPKRYTNDENRGEVCIIQKHGFLAMRPITNGFLASKFIAPFLRKKKMHGHAIIDWLKLFDRHFQIFCDDLHYE